MSKKKTSKYVPDFEQYNPADSTPVASIKARDILFYGIESIKSFYELFEKVRKQRLGSGKGGFTTHDEQDLLRSMLVFSAATLDSVVKQVIRDVVPSIEKLPAKAKLEFQKYIADQLTKGAPLNVKALANSLSGAEPRLYFIDEYVKYLTGDSLQSKDQVMKSAAAIGADLKLEKDDLKQMELLFEARNQIIHELDYLHTKAKKKQRNRRNRNRDEIIEWSESLLQIANRFLTT